MGQFLLVVSGFVLSRVSIETKCVLRKDKPLASRSYGFLYKT